MPHAPAYLAAVLAGSGVLVDSLTALHYQKLGLVVRRFAPRIAYRYSLILAKQRGRSGLTKVFIELLDYA